MISIPRAPTRDASRLLRVSLPLQRCCTCSPLLRTYATHSGAGQTNSTGRRQVTIGNDDGRIKWSDLSVKEKAARTTQQTINLAVVIAGLVATGTVVSFLFLDVFSPDSKTAHFNRAVTRLKKDYRCTEILGPGKEIVAFGEGSYSGWSRNRALASKSEKDKFGTEHLYMQFNVKGLLNSGRVHLHVAKRSNEDDFEYRSFYLDVPDHQRIYLENTDPQVNDKAAGKLFGVRWW